MHYADYENIIQFSFHLTNWDFNVVWYVKPLEHFVQQKPSIFEVWADRSRWVHTRNSGFRVLTTSQLSKIRKL